MQMQIKKKLCYFFFFFVTSFSIKNVHCNALLSLSITDPQLQTVSLQGYLDNQNSIQKILALLNPIETNSFDKNHYRSLYDFSISDTNVTFDTFVTQTNIENTLYAIDWSPDGQNLFIGGSPSTTMVNNVAGGRLSFTNNFTNLNLTEYLYRNQNVYAVAYHPSYPTLAIAGDLNGSSKSHHLYVIYYSKFNNNSSLYSVNDLNHGATIYSVAWSPDGKYLALAGNPSSSVALRIYSFENDRYLTEITRCRYNHNDTIKSIAWHPSGKYLALGGSPGTTAQLKVLYFDHESLTTIPKASITMSNTINSVAWHPSGNYLACSGMTFSTHLFSFDSFSLQLLSEQGHGNTVNSVSFSPNGSLLAAGGAPGTDGSTLRVYTTVDKTLSSLTACNRSDLPEIFTTKWHPSGIFLVTAGTQVSATSLALYQITENQKLLSRKIKKSIIDLSKNLDTDYVSFNETLSPLMKNTSNALLTYNPQQVLNSYTEITHIAIDLQQAFFIRWSPDSSIFLVGGRNSYNVMYVYKHKDGLLNLITTLDKGSGTATIYEADITKDNRHIAISPYYGYSSLYLYELRGNSLSFGTYIWPPLAAINYHFNFLDDDVNFVADRNRGAAQLSGFSIIDSNTRTRVITNKDRSLYAYSSGNTLYVARLKNNLEEIITSIDVGFYISFHGWESPSIIAVANDRTFKTYQFDGSNLNFIASTTISDQISSLAVDPQDKHVLVSTFNAQSYEYHIDIANAQHSLVGNFFPGLGWTLFDGTLKYSPDGNYIARVLYREYYLPIVTIFKRNFSNNAPLKSSTTTYTTLQGTSNALTNIINNETNPITVLRNLNIQNSNNLVITSTTIVTSSNNVQLIKSNSDAVAGLLVATSNAVKLITENSSAIISLRPFIITNSNNSLSLNTLLMTQNSYAVQNLTSLFTSTNLLIPTSNTAAGLLVDTSNAAYSIKQKEQLINTVGIDIGPSHIHFNSASITMSYNLHLSTDHQLFVHASGIVNGNGHSITFARGSGTQITVDPGITTTFQNVIFKDYNEQALSLDANASFIFGNNSHVELSENQTLLRTWSFAGYSQLNGLGNAVTLGTGPRVLSSLVNSSLQLSNLKLLNIRENNIRAANNNSAINFQDVTLNMSADYTYSIGSISVQNDLTIKGTSTFNYTTIMGLTVNPASQLTIDQGTTFNYAPNGNFRNLLSLTDSSARLFFNNATLVATATGPRLTKGTLLVDGKMNIQSSGVSSAEAVVFGDTTPNNDLLIKIMPEAGINLKTGFLNYANAN